MTGANEPSPGSNSGPDPLDVAPVMEPTTPLDTPVVPSDAREPLPPEKSLATGGTPSADIDGAVLADDGASPLPLGKIVTLPDNVRLDFLFEFCFDGCHLDAHFMDPNNLGL